MLDATGNTFKTALSALKPVDEATVEEISSEAGKCISIEWRSPLNSRVTDELLFSLARANLKRDVSVVKGIGKQTRQKLARGGICRLDDLVFSARRSWRAQACLLLDHIKEDRAGPLRATRRVKDLDLMFCFKPEKVAYIDIETTSMRADPTVFAIAIGVSEPREKRFKITQLFARDLGEEFAVVKRAIDLLEGIECIVTFNGKAFDVPILKGRAWYYLGEATPFLDKHHVDLVHELRRVKGLKRRACLAHYEATVLHEHRALDVPSASIPPMYARFIARGGGTAFTEFLMATNATTRTTHVLQPGINEALANADFEMADMFRVLYHNMVDVKSLHGLLGWALRESYAKAKARGPVEQD